MIGQQRQEGHKNTRPNERTFIDPGIFVIWHICKEFFVENVLLSRHIDKKRGKIKRKDRKYLVHLNWLVIAPVWK